MLDDVISFFVSMVADAAIEGVAKKSRTVRVLRALGWLLLLGFLLFLICVTIKYS